VGGGGEGIVEELEVKSKRGRKRKCMESGPDEGGQKSLQSRLLIALQSKRAKAEFIDTSRSLQRLRIQFIRLAMTILKVPLEALLGPTVRPVDVLHLSYSDPQRVRTIRGVELPGEKSITRLKIELAEAGGTRTSSFDRRFWFSSFSTDKRRMIVKRVRHQGAYVTDPIRLIRMVTSHSRFIAIGGDKGGVTTKLGVTYSQGNISRFIALVISTLDDDWEGLAPLNGTDLLRFEGDSAAYSSIFDALQSLVDAQLPCFLNGDWMFLNAILGLMSPSSSNPCPICVVEKGDLLRMSVYRSSRRNPSAAEGRTALIAIHPKNIVPIPLHLFLGIGNRIITECFSLLFGADLLESAISRVKSTHSSGCGGLADLHDLSGPELSQFIKKDCSTSLVAEFIESSSTPVNPLTSGLVNQPITRWLKELHSHLLHSNDWTVDHIRAFHALFNEIHQCWEAATQIPPFPKIHMLRHASEFAQNHFFLGLVSEAQIESTHAKINALFNHNHRNQSDNTAERLRRSLADATLRAVQSFVN
jgi:hypothetical protein